MGMRLNFSVEPMAAGGASAVQELAARKPPAPAAWKGCPTRQAHFPQVLMRLPWSHLAGTLTALIRCHRLGSESYVPGKKRVHSAYFPEYAISRNFSVLIKRWAEKV